MGICELLLLLCVCIDMCERPFLDTGTTYKAVHSVGNVVARLALLGNADFWIPTC
jgi:hypothetical protein